MIKPEIELPDAKGLMILVVGEVVLDRYVWGTVERISPEAPIPVLHLNRCEERLGNAAFVAASIRALGGEARVLSVIGPDADGSAICRMAEGLGIPCDSLVEEPGRPTIVKERLLGAVQSAERGVQQILRVDREDSRPVGAETEATLLERFAQEIGTADGVVVCDINKGLLTRRLLAEIIRTTRSQNKPTIIDPRRTEDFSIYRGATALTPNRFETQRATGLNLAAASDWASAGRKLVHDFDLSASLVTLDRDGMFLSERNGRGIHIETTHREVYDVTGAGDVVLAVFGFFWTAGMSPVDAAILANIAGSLEVARQGATVISRDELLVALRSDQRSTSQKILSLQDLRSNIDRHRRGGSRICFMDGSFDSLHVQHVRLLQFAQKQADLLVVGLHNPHVAQPINHVVGPKPSAADRAQIVAALEAVDYVVTFDDPGAAAIVHAIQPDVFVVPRENPSAETTDAGKLVRSYGGRVVEASLIDGIATPARIENGHSNGAAPGDDKSLDRTGSKCRNLILKMSDSEPD